jgi:hypothetical protein
MADYYVTYMYVNSKAIESVIVHNYYMFSPQCVESLKQHLVNGYINRSNADEIQIIAFSKFE